LSVLDELQVLEERVRARLSELRPLVAEYRELEEVAKRIGVDIDDASGQRPPTDPRNRSRGTSRTAPRRPAVKKLAGSSRGPSNTRSASRRRATGKPRAGGPGAGQRHQQLLKLVADRPGITVREAGEALDVVPTSL
jgi:hypothetical protein